MFDDDDNDDDSVYPVRSWGWAKRNSAGENKNHNGFLLGGFAELFSSHGVLTTWYLEANKGQMISTCPFLSHWNDWQNWPIIILGCPCVNKWASGAGMTSTVCHNRPAPQFNSNQDTLSRLPRLSKQSSTTIKTYQNYTEKKPSTTISAYQDYPD